MNLHLEKQCIPHTNKIYCTITGVMNIHFLRWPWYRFLRCQYMVWLTLLIADPLLFHTNLKEKQKKLVKIRSLELQTERLYVFYQYVIFLTRPIALYNREIERKLSKIRSQNFKQLKIILQKYGEEFIFLLWKRKMTISSQKCKSYILSGRI